jgi:hypothetical protein
MRAPSKDTDEEHADERDEEGKRENEELRRSTVIMESLAMATNPLKTTAAPIPFPAQACFIRSCSK